MYKIQRAFYGRTCKSEIKELIDGQEKQTKREKKGFHTEVDSILQPSLEAFLLDTATNYCPTGLLGHYNFTDQ